MVHGVLSRSLSPFKILHFSQAYSLVFWYIRAIFAFAVISSRLAANSRRGMDLDNSVLHCCFILRGRFTTHERAIQIVMGP